MGVLGGVGKCGRGFGEGWGVERVGCGEEFGVGEGEEVVVPGEELGGEADVDGVDFIIQTPENNFLKCQLKSRAYVLWNKYGNKDIYIRKRGLW
jgi:hypothetical protein